MELNEYQQRASVTNTYSDNTLGVSARFMGLSGEAGEATDKAKKEVRDFEDTAYKDSDRNKAIALELGDTMWYIAMCAKGIGYSLEDICKLNLDKLESRSKRGKIHGSGDYR